MRAIVIGSGVIGSSVAYELAKAGAKVSVFEKGRIASGASAVSFAWTNANGKRPREYHALNVAGMRAYVDLAREFDSARWFNQTGSFEWWTTEAAQAKQLAGVKLEQEWGYGVDFISRDRITAMEPDIKVQAIGDAPIVYYPEEGWIDPVLYAACLLRSASERWGAQVYTGTQIKSLETRSGRVSGVRTAAGERFEADVVVSCTGGASQESLGDIPGIPMKSTIGVLAFTQPVAMTLRRQFHADDLDVRPDGAGRLMLHKISVDDQFSEPKSLQPDGFEATTILNAARELLPALEAVSIEAIRTTVRPIPGDGLTCAGPMPQVDGYYVGVTHSGVTIAPQLARLLADEIVRGNIREELSMFRPSRFFDGAPGSVIPKYAVAGPSHD
ncbi:MAG: FAD-binding oxidoreductase [Mesorhizobium sp.]|uniref:NAD(P)/FAD-dependent oxidoreductase n=1 Tax=Mesorhizobium sp. TaxID=1871066 RepID=UPI000FE57BA2|nr:FAD-binding oxidoreductase [Mesorhizobium sp.]RWH82125.1 MAG: FAD-binding oxidoreductase [Mesorhizobium sp.]RWH85126.1 MAG: FAD-binding oxidoreductase [Mesorhizobium sp.]RWH89881.1 MAG: FAD-binding oxidoreductase [Mesorhizobium sp.]RWH98371.1 MAG: FAD-binding oxidoreductase [Mesorhizobium sp.]RWI04623.1 MAG: FAD-binding oxidoreductase [Mesorhizobium sp.]